MSTVFSEVGRVSRMTERFRYGQATSILSSKGVAKSVRIIATRAGGPYKANGARLSLRPVTRSQADRANSRG